MSKKGHNLKNDIICNVLFKRMRLLLQLLLILRHADKVALHAKDTPKDKLSQRICIMLRCYNDILLSRMHFDANGTMPHMKLQDTRATYPAPPMYL